MGIAGLYYFLRMSETAARKVNNMSRQSIRITLIFSITGSLVIYRTALAWLFHRRNFICVPKLKSINFFDINWKIKKWKVRQIASVAPSIIYFYQYKTWQHSTYVMAASYFSLQFLRAYYVSFALLSLLYCFPFFVIAILIFFPCLRISSIVYVKG